MLLKKLWNFIWHDDSILSWIVNIILALVLVKFIIYPGLGFIFNTTHPLVAVVSGSMEHNKQNFDNWWSKQGSWYEQQNIRKEVFSRFPFKNGFSKGDIMILTGTKNLKRGDVIVFIRNGGSQIPVIHRIVEIQKDGLLVYATKGDNNNDRDPWKVDAVLGKAVLRIPYLGYVKILFVDYILNPLRKTFL